MRLFRTICAPAFVLAIPAFLAFQMAARPILSCGENACDLLVLVMPCLAPDGATCAQKPTSVRTGCCLDEEPVELVGGCCAAKPEPKPSPCAGCAENDEPEPLCSQSHKNSTDMPSGRCPEGKPLCVLCPTIPVAAEPSPTRALRRPSTQILAALHIPKVTTEVPSGPLLIDSHAPPFSCLARAGPQRRVMLCSFLL